MASADARRMGLPIRPFHYSVDQIAEILSLSTNRVRVHYIYYEGRHTGLAPKDRMVAKNLNPTPGQVDWRVSEVEFIRWLKRQGYRIYDTSYLEPPRQSKRRKPSDEDEDDQDNPATFTEDNSSPDEPRS